VHSDFHLKFKHRCARAIVSSAVILFSIGIALAAKVALRVALAQSAPVAQAPPRPTLFVVLDPGHGGADAGAHGATGAVEKDLTLILARDTRAELQRLGFRVVMTREGDDDPSFDDRAAIANAQHSAIFISLHFSSTGQPGTVHVYSYPSAAASPAPDAGSAAAPAPAAKPANRLVPWNEAQAPYADASHRLAELTQGELAHIFPGSPVESTAFPIRILRSVAAPAIAVELSSVAVEDPHSLDNLIPPLAATIARGAAAFRPTYQPGAP